MDNPILSLLFNLKREFLNQSMDNLI